MIDSGNVLLLLTCLLLIMLAGYLGEKTKWGQLASAPLIILFISFAIGNLGIMPAQAPTYTQIQSLLVPLAIPLLLFGADLKSVFTESRLMVKAFFLAVASTVLGVFIAATFIDMGELHAQIAGTLAASYIGGSTNFVSTAQAVELAEASIYSAALTADALVAIIFLGLLMALPSVRFISRRFDSHSTHKEPSVKDSEVTEDQPPATELGIALTLTVSAVICALGMGISLLVPIPGMFIIAITILALVVANFAPAGFKRHTPFGFKVGTFFMYLFFATIGLGADLSAVLGAAMHIVLFLLVVVAIHLIIISWLGPLLKLPLPVMLIASSACILGPAPAAAIAASRGWRQLITPGMLAGVLGYAIATFIGIGIAMIL